MQKSWNIKQPLILFLLFFEEKVFEKINKL